MVWYYCTRHVVQFQLALTNWCLVSMTYIFGSFHQRLRHEHDIIFLVSAHAWINASKSLLFFFSWYAWMNMPIYIIDIHFTCLDEHFYANAQLSLERLGSCFTFFKMLKRTCLSILIFSRWICLRDFSLLFFVIAWMTKYD